MKVIKELLNRYLPVFIVIALVSLALFYIPIKADSGVSKEVYIIGAIDQRTALRVIGELTAADKTPGDITLLIDSGGGGVAEGFLIIDTMRVCNNDIKTVVLTEACSMAAVVASAGTPGKRYAYPHSILLLHQMGMTYLEGQNVDKWYKMIEIISKIEKQLCEEIAKNTGHSSLEIRQSIKEDMWMTALEARNYGLIDIIIERPIPVERRDWDNDTNK